MSLCDICKNSMSNRSPGVQCVSCRRCYHANGRCCEVTKSQGIVIATLPGNQWSCRNCRSQDSVATVASIDDGGSEQEVDDGSEGTTVLAELVRALKTELGEVRSEIRELRSSVDFCSNQVSDFENKLSLLDEAIRVTSYLKAENETLKKRIGIMEARFGDVEQSLRSNNVEIMDVPERKNENLFEIVKKIGNFIGHEVTDSSVNTIMRVPTKLENKPKNIIVKFNRKLDRDSFLSAAKSKKTELGGKPGLELLDVSKRFYVNEHLTTANKILFRETRVAAKEKKDSEWRYSCSEG